jgi:hypothetical protein
MAALSWAEEILDELEARQIRVEPRGQHLELVGPRGALPAELAEEIREHKRELLELVRLRGWPADSVVAVRLFGQPHARLYPFVNQAVGTPVGRGKLLQVFAERAVVALDRDLRRVVYLLPSEVWPTGTTYPPGETFEPVN